MSNRFLIQLLVTGKAAPPTGRVAQPRLRKANDGRGVESEPSGFHGGGAGPGTGTAHIRRPVTGTGMVPRLPLLDGTRSSRSRTWQPSCRCRQAHRIRRRDCQRGARPCSSLCASAVRDRSPCLAAVRLRARGRWRRSNERRCGRPRSAESGRASRRGWHRGASPFVRESRPVQQRGGFRSRRRQDEVPAAIGSIVLGRRSKAIVRVDVVEKRPPARNGRSGHRAGRRMTDGICPAHKGRRMGHARLGSPGSRRLSSRVRPVAWRGIGSPGRGHLGWQRPLVPHHKSLPRPCDR